VKDAAINRPFYKDTDGVVKKRPNSFYDTNKGGVRDTTSLKKKAIEASKAEAERFLAEMAAE